MPRSTPIPPAISAAVLFVLSAGVWTVRGGLPRPIREGAGSFALCSAALALSGHRVRFLLPLAALGLAAARVPDPLPESTHRAERAAPPLALRGRMIACEERTDGSFELTLDRLRSPEGRALDRPGRQLVVHTLQGRPPPGALQVAGLLVQGPWGVRLERAAWGPVTPRTREAWTPDSSLSRLRDLIRERLETSLPPEEAGLARALLLGEREAVPSGRLHAYRDLGLLHLLAVSGMHFWLWDALLRRLLPRRMAWLRPPGLLAAGVLAGGRPSVVRATSAILLRDLAAWRGRRLSGGTLWCTALWAELALVPPRSSGLGLVLSYSAAGVLLLQGRRGRSWLHPFRASLLASLATAPWIHALQGSVQPWSILLTPFAAALLPLRMLLGLAACFPGGGPVAATILAPIGGLEGRLLTLADRLPGSPLPLPRIPSLLLACCCASLLVLLLRRHREENLRARAAPWMGLLLSVAASLRPATGAPGLLMLPVGHGLACVVSDGERSLVYDCGNATSTPRRLLRQVLIPALHRHRWPFPRWTVASHADLDHTLALPLLQEMGARPLTCPAGGRLALAWKGMTLDLYGCRSALPQDSNSGGQALELHFPRGRVLLLGDQAGYSLRELLGRLEEGPLELLVLPHHGLSTDGLPEALDRLLPRRSWASCGAGDLPLPASPLMRRRGIPLRDTLAGELFLPATPGGSPSRFERKS